MLWNIDPDQMREMERAFMERTGMPGMLLMERAALSLQPFLFGLERVLFVCGAGNNGGDGLAAARLFAAEGGEALVWLTVPPERLSGDALANARLLEGLGIPIRVLRDEVPALPEADLAVDALFGTGLCRPLEGLNARLVEALNASGLPILSVDIPSGIEGATGRVLGKAVRAARTVTFHRPKPGHYLYPGRAHTGRLTVESIGIPAAWDGAPGLRILTDGDIPALLPPRKPDSHKGDCGHVLCVAGSRGMAGAAALCAQAALRGGAGLVTLACPDELVDTLQCLAPCAMALAVDSPQALERALAGKRCAVVGPGLSQGAGRWELLAPLFEADIPQVWDADGLNLLARFGGKPPRGAVLTPHPGEAARLLDWTMDRILDDPRAAAQALADQTGATVLLKGATTLIVQGERGSLNVSGCAGLATGGSGDVLAGLIGALLAQGLPAYDAACLGAFLHGRAGERAASELGERCMTAWDLPERLLPAPDFDSDEAL